MTPHDRAAAMVTPPAAMHPLERALSYPYAAPAHSYLFRGGEAVPAAIGAEDRSGRIPVLACGSNRAPAQLKRKFAAMPEALIPVERVFLADFDSVYAAHISGYGAIAATLQHCPGCRVELFITWLPESLMPRMHATEGRGAFYDYVRLDGIALASETGERFDRAYAYSFRGGCLNLGGQAAAVAACRRLAGASARSAKRRSRPKPRRSSARAGRSEISCSPPCTIKPCASRARRGSAKTRWPSPGPGRP